MNTPIFRRATTQLVRVLLGTVLAAATAPLLADGYERDHERARAALAGRELLALKEVLSRLGQTHPGTVIEVELEREDGIWMYEIKQLSDDGRVMHLEVDARTGDVLRVKGRREERS